MACDRNERVLAEVAKQKADEVRERTLASDVNLDDVSNDDDDESPPSDYDSFASDDEYFDGDDVTPPVPPRLPVEVVRTQRAAPLPPVSASHLPSTDVRFQPRSPSSAPYPAGYV